MVRFQYIIRRIEDNAFLESSDCYSKANLAYTELAAI